MLLTTLHAMKRVLGFLRRRTGAATRLVDCESCGADFVNPVAWHALSESRWWMRLRCAECGFVREVELSNRDAARFDAQLAHGMAVIAWTAANIS